MFSAAFALISIGRYVAGGLCAAGALGCVLFALLSKNSEIAASPPLPIVTFPDGTKLHQHNMAIYIENVGGAVARNVQVQPVDLAMGWVFFRRIGALRPGERQPLEVANAGTRGGKSDDLRTLWNAVKLGVNCWLAFAAKHTPTVPISITFRDGLWREHVERQTVTIDADERVLTRSNTPKGGEKK